MYDEDSSSQSSTSVSQSRPAILPATLSSFREEMEVELEGRDEFISVKVTSPHRVGKGWSSYMAYTVTTATNLSYFTKKNPIVSRRFSDFLGLRDKLSEKYLRHGHIIPPAPDKSVIGMAKVKLAKEEDTDHSQFVEKRRASLERFLKRTAGHPSLRLDPDFWEFLEVDTVLPRANQTSALSGRNVLRMIRKVGDTGRMEETDRWFEEITAMLINLDSQLQKLHVAAEARVECRKTLSGHTASLSRNLAMLSIVEDSRELRAAISRLAEVEEDVGRVYQLQAEDDFFLVSELVRDYIGMVGSVREVLGERVKAWQSWQGIQSDLDRKKEAKTKAELAGKQDRINILRQEIAEIERQVEVAQRNFEKISRTIKKGFEVLEVKKFRELQQTLLKYAEQMAVSQGSMVTLWQHLLPEILQMET